nr:MAG TPA: hypothetical protein [Bacteriophage sp.]
MIRFVICSFRCIYSIRYKAQNQYVMLHKYKAQNSRIVCVLCIRCKTI